METREYYENVIEQGNKHLRQFDHEEHEAYLKIAEINRQRSDLLERTGDAGRKLLNGQYENGDNDKAIDILIEARERVFQDYKMHRIEKFWALSYLDHAIEFLDKQK